MAGEGPLTFGATVSLAATTATGNVAVSLPAGQQIVVTNLGPDLAYIAVGTSGVTATLAGGFPVLPASQITISLPINTTFIAAITPTSTAALKVSSGDGVVYGLGAGSSGAAGGPTANVAIVAALPTGTNTIGSVKITDGTNGNAAVKAASTAAVTTDTALVVGISPNGQLPSGRAADANSVPVALSNEDVAVLVQPYPVGRVALVAASGNKANSSAAATLTPGSTVTAFIAGFEVTAAGATVGLPVTVTVTGILGGTLSYIFAAPAGALIIAQPLVVEFNPPLPASAVNTAIVVTCPALGTGNTNAAVVAHGYSA